MLYRVADEYLATLFTVDWVWEQIYSKIREQHQRWKRRESNFFSGNVLWSQFVVTQRQQQRRRRQQRWRRQPQQQRQRQQQQQQQQRQQRRRHLLQQQRQQQHLQDDCLEKCWWRNWAKIVSPAIPQSRHTPTESIWPRPKIWRIQRAGQTWF